eukprot:3853064-Rhodomonas_salina.1
MRTNADRRLIGGVRQVAAKEMHGQVTQPILDDLRNEVELLTQIDHPNCHYMLGCKLMPDGQGGPLLLTEVCPALDAAQARTLAAMTQSLCSLLLPSSWD